MKEEIIKNIIAIRSRINLACAKSGRDPKDVRLLMATKTVPAERIQWAIESGEPLIGENKIQELKEKYLPLKGVAHENHFIGHLQTNKIKELLKCDVACIQSLDRIELARKLHQRLLFEKKTIEAFIQVNTSNEESKFGVSPGKALELVKEVSKFTTLKITGLMTIGLFSAEEDKVRPCFQLLKQLQQEIIQARIPGVQMRELSMGMSGDLEIAIEEGATIVRVGTAIFGQRKYSDSYYWNESSRIK